MFSSTQKLALCAIVTASVLSAGGVDGGRRKASNFSCTFFPVSLLSDRLGTKGAEVGHGGVATLTRDIRAIGAQSCVTMEPECSYVMVP